MFQVAEVYCAALAFGGVVLFLETLHYLHQFVGVSHAVDGLLPQRFDTHAAKQLLVLFGKFVVGFVHRVEVATQLFLNCLIHAHRLLFVAYRQFEQSCRGKICHRLRQFVGGKVATRGVLSANIGAHVHTFFRRAPCHVGKISFDVAQSIGNIGKQRCHHGVVGRVLDKIVAFACVPSAEVFQTARKLVQAKHRIAETLLLTIASENLAHTTEQVVVRLRILRKDLFQCVVFDVGNGHVVQYGKVGVYVRQVEIVTQQLATKTVYCTDISIV